MEHVSFFSTLSGCAPETALLRCQTQAEVWRFERAALVERRAALPRSDKQGAHELMVEINRIDAALKRVRLVAAHYRGEAERKESHYLWVDAVKAVAGQDTYAACVEWIKAEKKRRASNASPQDQGIPQPRMTHSSTE